jgi:hypothetical protein
MCVSPVVKELNSLSYDVIREPREGITPLMVLANASGRMERLGLLSAMIVNTVMLPEISPDQAAATINIERTDSFEFGFGIQLLKQLLKALGAPSADLSASFQNSNKLEFKYENVISNSVDLIALGGALKSAMPDIGNDLVRQLNGDGKAYVIVEILKSNAFSVTAKDSNGLDLKVELPGIQEVLGANVKVGSKSEGSRAVTFSGSKHLCFAFKSAPIWVEVTDSARFRLSKPSVTGLPMDLSAHTDALKPELLGAGELLRLR